MLYGYKNNKIQYVICIFSCSFFYYYSNIHVTYNYTLSLYIAINSCSNGGSNAQDGPLIRTTFTACMHAICGMYPWIRVLSCVVKARTNQSQLFCRVSKVRAWVSSSCVSEIFSQWFHDKILRRLVASICMLFCKKKKRTIDKRAV